MTVRNTFNEFFEKAVDGLGITENTTLLTEVGDITDTVEKALKSLKITPVS